MTKESKATSPETDNTTAGSPESASSSPLPPAPAVRALFNMALACVAAAIIGAALGIPVSAAGVSLQPKGIDLPILLGLLVLFMGNFNYYTKVIEPVGESDLQTIITVFGTLAMILLPIFMIVQETRHWRFLAVAGYGILVVVKNQSLTKRALAVGDEALMYGSWRRRAMFQTGALLGFGVLYYVLMKPSTRAWLFQRIVDAPVLTFKPAYETFVDLTFGIAFMMAILGLFVLHQGDLRALKRAS